MADNDTKTTDPKPADVEKARAEEQAARQRAIDAQAKADDDKKTDAQRAADAARSKTAEAEASLVPTDPMTAVEAKIISPHVTDDMGAGDHLAQQFSNQPANPQIAKAEHADPDLCTVKLTMTKADGLGAPVATMVHPEMVGDYLRAGWAKA